MKLLSLIMLLMTSSLYAVTESQALNTEMQSYPSNRRVNVSTNPLTTLYLLPNINVEFAVTDNITLGVSGMTGGIWMHLLEKQNTDYEYSMYGYGASAKYYFNRALADSGYAKIAYDRLNVSGHSKIDNTGGTVGINAYKLGAGYMWMWSSFNIQLGGDLALTDGDGQIRSTDGSKVKDLDKVLDRAEAVAVGIDFSIGFAF
jgi:hypothetical protein